MKLHRPLLSSLVLSAFAFTAFAEAASLKENVTVYSSVVVAGDLFDGLDEYNDEPLFLAPDIGKSGKISAYRVAEEAHDLGIYDLQLNNIKSVTVRRPSIIVNREEARRRLRGHIAEQMSDKIDLYTPTLVQKARFLSATLNSAKTTNAFKQR